MDKLVIEIAHNSEFTKDGGRVIFKEDGKDDLYSQKLIPVEETDLKLPAHIKYLNPVQSVFYLFHEHGKSALIATPTSSGKTLIGLIKINKVLKEGKRVVFTAPLKALTREKFNEFVEIFGANAVERRDGDNFLNNYAPIKNQTKIIVTTNEFLATAIRNNSDWLDSVGLFIIDEIHQIYKKSSIEEIIIYAKEREKEILGLSATIPNIEELADYINASLVIKSNFRPVPLERDTKDAISNTKYKEIYLAMLKDLSLKGEKVILFTTKKSMWNILEEANKREDFIVLNETTPFHKDEEIEKSNNAVKIAVHNASIPPEERVKIEEAFKKDDLNIIIATQTLAYGINMPADTIIIDVTRINKDGKSFIFPDQLDIKQMEGRAGRFGIKEKGKSILVPRNLKKEDLENYMKITFIPEQELKFRNIMILLLIAIKNKGGNFKSFLDQMFKRIDDKYVNKALNFISQYNYITQDFLLTEKGEFSIKQGIDPLALETAIHYFISDIPLHLKVRPLLHLKNFSDSRTLLNDESLEAKEYIMLNRYNMTSFIRKEFLSDLRTFLDTTIVYDMYIRGEIVEYPNISGVPGDLASLSKDALYLLRLLLALKKKKWIDISNEEILKVVHAVKFGIEPEFSFIPTIPKLGYIRSNLIKMYLQDSINKSYYSKLNFMSTLEDLESIIILENYQDYFIDFYINVRKLPKSRAQSELTKIANIIMSNKYKHENRANKQVERRLIDREILVAGVLEKTDKHKITYSYVKEISKAPSEELYKIFIEEE
ncbi:MAG: DEAD/DEAH box helicase [Candidatus Aenigmatarchaeota archaeon]